MIGERPLLVAVNDGTFPVPLFDPNPISGDGVERLQLNVVPATGLLKTTEGTDAPAQ